MFTIIRIEPNGIGAHDYQTSNLSFSCPEGWAIVPDSIDMTDFHIYNGFVTLTIEDNTVTSYTPNTEACEAWKTVPIEQLRVNAQSRIDGCCSAAIASGVTVNKLHYTLTALAQHDLSVMVAQAKAGTASFLYHADGEAMRVYTADEITAIAAAATEWFSINTAYYDLLKAWVTRETDVDKLGAIKYGSKLPDDLMTQLTDLCKSVGIDATKYAALFTA